MWLYAKQQKTSIYKSLHWLNRALLYQRSLKNSAARKELFLMPLNGYGKHGRTFPVRTLFIWLSRSKKLLSGSMKNGGMNFARESGKRPSRSNNWRRNSGRMAGIKLTPLIHRSACPPPRKPSTHWVLKSPMPGLFGIYTMMLHG